MKNKNNKSGDKKWGISFLPILKYNIILCIMTVLIIIFGVAIFTIQNMKNSTHEILLKTDRDIEYRIDQSIRFLKSLASQKRYYDPKVPIEEKIAELDMLNTYYGYLMIRYVDSDVNVYSQRGASSLASCDYMQRLFSTREVQVTDSFAAGADGKTLNYTIAVPLIQDNKIVGAIFCALYFDEIVNLLKESAHSDKVDITLIGRKNQIMSSIGNENYGELFLDSIRKTKLLTTTSDKIQKGLLEKDTKHYWGIEDGDIIYGEYTDVKNTNWNIIVRSYFWDTYKTVFGKFVPIILLGIFFCGITLWFIKRYIESQMKAVDILVHSVQELEKKIYQDENPDFQEILRLTSTGLSDGLTGVVTRTVFMNQLQGQLKKIDTEKITAFCFIDLDDLKIINDTYGHKLGDIALKNIGYVLREYEKKYDGIVGRYGGDEFVLLLTDLEDDKELEEVVSEMALRLHFDIKDGIKAISIRCSVGVSIWKQNMSIDKLITDADEALYFVKQNGKGDFKICQR
ncbi:sensor domain-containing diguanylate cyclase [Fusobacterium ulcerans]|uniref:sensor domain-containing diguanylate cyclase n=1 Tax=Fusobacterium ulcerans TaxID=861 RepID=UPI002672C424|nr:diguanylate cyclase [Fusobacterium ulcerans]